MELIANELDHVDAQIHELTRFVDEHRPALTRALSFLDIGKGWRGWRRTASGNYTDQEMTGDAI